MFLTRLRPIDRISNHCRFLVYTSGRQWVPKLSTISRGPLDLLNLAIYLHSMTTEQLAQRLLPLAKALVAVLEEASSISAGVAFDSGKTDRRPVADLTKSILGLVAKIPGLTTAEVAERLLPLEDGITLDLMKRRVAVNLSYQNKKRGTVVGRKVPGKKELLWFINLDKTATPPKGGDTVDDHDATPFSDSNPEALGVQSQGGTRMDPSGGVADWHSEAH